jgi:hypothetical protein
MKRRHFVQALAALPVAPLAAQQAPPAPPAPAPARGGGRGAAAAEDLPKLEVAFPEDAADSVLHFFTPPQFAALQRLGDLLMPAGSSSPGALAAGAPEFLDFLIGDSGADRQQVYRAGLDGLNAQARRQFNKAFADTDSSQADALLVSLRQPWTYADPADPVARFLRAAKADMRTATVNSHAASNGRRFAGSGLYWYPLD